MIALIILSIIFFISCCILLVKYMQASESKVIYEEKLRQLFEEEAQHNQRPVKPINESFKSSDSLSNWLITDCGETAVRCAMCGMEVPIITRGNVSTRHQLQQRKWEIRHGRPYCPTCIEKEKELKAKQSIPGPVDKPEKVEGQLPDEPSLVDIPPVNSVLDE